MNKKQKKFLISGLIACILAATVLGVYFAPFPEANTINIWFSNNRITGLNDQNETILFDTAKITYQNPREINWSNNGLETELYVENLTILSLCEGIIMWANDSLGIYKYPIVSIDDEYYNNQLYSITKKVNIVVNQNGINQTLPYFNIQDDKGSESYAYVNLNQLDALLGIDGNTSYTISLIMDVFFEVNIPSPIFHSSNPNKISEEKTIDFGYIEITCINGHHSLAHVNFPYQELSYPIKIPFMQKILP